MMSDEVIDPEFSDPDFTRTVYDLVDHIETILFGHSHQIQGTVLVGCVAIWLSRYFVPDDSDATAALQRDLLDAHTSAVKELIDAP